MPEVTNVFAPKVIAAGTVSCSLLMRYLQMVVFALHILPLRRHDSFALRESVLGLIRSQRIPPSLTAASDSNMQMSEKGSNVKPITTWRI